MKQSTLSEYMAARGVLVEQQLSQLVPDSTEPHRSLFQAARYSLLGPGKRLRPILALATAETLGARVEVALTPACALEMIHAYSLIHDDLPCMDDDDYRRGRPSLHKAFSEGHAVLAGDFLLTQAFEVLAHALHLTSEQRIQLVAILSKRAGGEGMIAGQIMDVEAEGKQISLEMLRCIHSKKTGALITASVEFGAVIAGVSQKEREILRQFGEEVGLAFQVVDDVLDVTASEQKHGKTIGSDVVNNKSTYVTLLGLGQATILAQQLFLSAIEKLRQLSYDTALLTQLAELVVQRKK